MVRPPPVTSVAGSSRGTSPGDTAGRLRSTCRVPSPSTSATSAGRVFDRICLIHRGAAQGELEDRKSTRLNSSHVAISYAVFCVKKKKEDTRCTPYGHDASVQGGRKVGR